MNTILKSLIFLLTVMNISNIYSQRSLKGVYSSLARYQDAYEYFKFEENGDFEYHEGSCLGDNVYGSGKYELKKDLLILNFNKTELIPLSYHKEEIYLSNNDSITIEIQFIDINDQLSIPNVQIWESYKKTVGVTNSDGFIKLKYKRDKEKIDLTFWFIGYPEYKVSLNRYLNYQIKMFWAPALGGVPIKSQIDSLKIHKSSMRELILGNENWKTKTWIKFED